MSAAFTSLATAAALVVPLAGGAHAAVGDAQPWNPDNDGPGNVISDLADGTDSLYHIVATVEGASGADVDALIDDEDLDDTVDYVVQLSLVAGTNDTFAAFWDIPADAQTAGTGAEPASLTIRVNGESKGSEPINLNPDALALEITSPDNGGTLEFFNRTATVQGTASDAATNVDVFYTTAAPGAEPTWTLCADDVVVGADDTWTASCALATGVAETEVTGVAARVDNDTDDVIDTNESGDAHRVTGAAQTPSALTVVPESDNQTVGFCNTYTATLVDAQGDPVVGANIDVHASYPETVTSVQFAQNSDVEGTESDPFTAPDGGTHSAYEPAAGCDQVGEPDEIPDDTDDTDVSDGTPVAGEAGVQGVHADTPSSTEETIHIEGSTATDGTFKFSLTSDAAVQIDIGVWYDADGDDLLDVTELQDSASKTFQTVQARNVDAEPESDTNAVGETHTVTGTVTDQNGNPVDARLTFKVTSGPNADETTLGDADGNPSDPAVAGVIGQCDTGADGTCQESYTETAEEGTDTIVVFIDEDNDLVADSTEPQDTVTKTWVSTATADCLDLEPNTDTNATTDTHTLTAYVTNGTFDGTDETGVNDCSGDPVAGVPVDFSVGSDDTPNVNFENGTNTTRKVTDANGVATATLDNVDDVAGENTTLQADVPQNTEDTAAGAGTAETVAKTWVVAGEPASITCTPESDVNEVGATHTVTATVEDGLGNPVSGVNVDFQVTAGPHSNNDLDNNATTPTGYFGEGTTGTNGQTSASYTGSETGTDTITCFIDETDDDSFDGGEMNDTVTKQWLAAGELSGGDIAIDMFAETGAANATGGDESVQAGDDTQRGTANTAVCTQDLQNFAIAESADNPDEDGDEFPTETDAQVGDDWDAAHTGTVNTVELVCVSAKDASGNVLVNAQVTLTSGTVGSIVDADGSNAEQSKSEVIGSDGYATFYILSTEAAQQTVTASIDGVNDTATGTKTYEAGEARNVDLAPEDAVNPPGTIHTVTATVTDKFGNPVEGVVVTFTETGAGAFRNGTSTATDTTDANGQATAETTTAPSEEGTQTITATIDPATTDCELAADDPETGDPAGNCSDSVTKTWADVANVNPIEEQSQEVETGQPVCLPFKVADSNGTGVEGVTVRAELTGPNGDVNLTGASGPCPTGTQTSATAEAVTDANGLVHFTYTPTESGTDTLVAWADLDGDNVQDDNEPAGTYTINVQAAQQPGDEGEVTRLEGGGGGTQGDRHTTAVAISQNAFPTAESQDNVVLARSTDYADALSGTPLAVKLVAPMLLTPDPTATPPEWDIHPATQAEIDRLLTPNTGDTVYILGEIQAIGLAAENQLEAQGYNVVRVGGADRFETAVEIAEQITGPTGTPASIFVTTGTNFPDALTAGAAAADQNGVIVLSAGDQPVGVTTQYLDSHTTTKYAVGQPAAEAYDSRIPESNELFVPGTGRYETAMAVVNEFWPNGHPQVGIARGDLFPDGLSGGTHIGLLGGPLLLTTPDTLLAEPQTYLENNAEVIDQAYLYGGPVALSETVRTQVDNAITAG